MLCPTDFGSFAPQAGAKFKFMTQPATETVIAHSEPVAGRTLEPHSYLCTPGPNAGVEMVPGYVCHTSGSA
jgi:hypothetical protein